MRRFCLTGMVIVALVQTGCGNVTSSQGNKAGTAGSPTPSALASSVRPGELLFAVTAGPNGVFGPTNSVAIVGLDGRARAKAQFKPMAVPALGCGEAGYTPPVATPAGGALLYLSSDGVIRRLSPAGEVADMIHLPVLTDQQASWFAASPDGKQLMASIIAFPPIVPSTSCISHQPGPTRIELLKGGAGTSFSVLKTDQQDTSKSPPQNVLTPVAWDSAGAIATTDPAWFGIGSPSGQIWGATAVHLDSSAHPGAPIGGGGCQALYGTAANGDVLCYDRLQPNVRDAAGNLLWKLRALGSNDGVSYGDVSLSPDAAHVAFALYNDDFSYNSAVIRGRDGTRIGLSGPFQPAGWLDTDTVIGLTGAIKVQCSGCAAGPVFNELAVVRVSNPSRIETLGLNARFVGVVQAAS